MQAIPANLRPFWDQFARASALANEGRFYDTCQFGDEPALIDALTQLVLRGTKRATAGSLWSYEDAGIRPPQPGDLSIVLDSARMPKCVIETRSVELVQFKDVTAEFAAIEGEGDGSLAYWRQAHRDYFMRECARSGRTFTDTMVLACERFEVIYRAEDAA